MLEWIALKDQIVQWLGLDRDALQIYAGLLIQLAAAALLRRPVSSPWPWLAVLAVEVANEAASTLADGLAQDWELAGNLQDLWVTMLAPTALMLVARFRPRLLSRRAELVFVPQALLEHVGSGPQAEDAEYVDYVEDEGGAWRADDR